MAKRRDSKGNILKRGECVRKSDGKYVYTFTDPMGRRRFIYANSLVELRNKETELKRDQLDGLDAYVRGYATINMTFDRYISTRKSLRDSTLSNYTYMYDRFVRESFGLRKIADIKYSDVVQFYLYLLDELDLAPATLDNIHCMLRPTFELAVRDDIIRKNPTDGVVADVVKQSGKSKGVKNALTKAQQRAFMDYVANHPIYSHWWPLFTVLLGTGTRIGECLGLRWEDIDLEKGFIEINHSVAYYPTKGTRTSVLKVHLPKTEAGIRKIPILEQVKDAFEMAKEEQDEEGVEQPYLDGMIGFVFLNRFGDVMNPQSVYRVIKRIISSYNKEEELEAAREHREPVYLPNFSCHILRHTFATRLCEKCSNQKVIQSVMGHKDIRTTLEVYADATDEKNKEIFEMLSYDLNDLF